MVYLDVIICDAYLDVLNVDSRIQIYIHMTYIFFKINETHMNQLTFNVDTTLAKLNSLQMEPEISQASYFDGTRRSPRYDVLKYIKKMSHPHKHVCTESAIFNELIQLMTQFPASNDEK